MFKKSLQELVTSFTGNIYARQAKIRGKIDSLEKEAEAIKAAIQAQTRTLIDCELNDDSAGQDRANKDLRKLREELAAVEGILDGYRQTLNEKAFNPADLEQIRTAALRELQGRKEGIKALEDDRESVQRQINELTNRLKQIDADINRARNNTEERKLISLLPYIEPRSKVVPSYEHERIIGHWISGEADAMERTITKYTKTEDRRPRSHATSFTPPPPNEGAAYTGHLVRPGLVSPRSNY